MAFEVRETIRRIVDTAPRRIYFEVDQPTF